MTFTHSNRYYFNTLILLSYIYIYISYVLDDNDPILKGYGMVSFILKIIINLILHDKYFVCSF